MAEAGPALVPVDALPEYPLGPEVVLPGHRFVAWEFRRWINSETRLLLQLDARGAARDLFDLAQDQRPIGTLPDDDVQLAALLAVPLPVWRELRARRDSPLRGWRRCRAGGQVRLMHPVVLDTLLEALARRERRAEGAEAGRRARRAERLEATMRRAGASGRMAADPGVREAVQAWLEAHCARGEPWTVARVRAAMEAISVRDASA